MSPPRERKATAAERIGLRLANVTVRVGEATLLDDVSLDVARGTIAAVVGPNGAGKTTLLDAISGVVPATGVVHIGDGHANGHRPGTPRPGVGRVFQGSPLPETMTVAEVVSLVSASRADAATVLQRFGLTPHATSFVAELSTGMRRILDLAIATVGEPSVLLLDEPASGLAQSEVELLATVVRRLRDESDAAVIVVEHDAWLVREIADEVIVLESGRVVARGTSRSVLAKRRGKGVRLHSPHEAHFKSALVRVAEGAAPAPGLPRRTLSKWTLLRMGLRELSAGLSSVLILGVLSRVLKVELGISLGVVTAILASYNLAAPAALAVGHRSDTRPIFGKRRTPYIVAGAILTGLCVAGAPHVAGRLAHGVSFQTVALSLLLFTAMGVGMYGAGTVFFALIADRSGPEDRGHAASVVYLELMVGVLAGVALTAAVLREDAQNIGTLFAIAGLAVVLLSIVAVWGQEKDIPPENVERHEGPRPSLRTAVATIAAIPQARLFFFFMILSTLFLFLQQAVLTSFGGEVLGLSVHSTTGFNAMLTVGTIVGMVIAGRPFAQQMGYRRIASTGLVLSVVAFAGLAAAAGTAAAPPAWLAILFLGFAGGIFNVSTLAIMMGMADRRRTALFMGAWTLAHALADAVATAGGGSVYEIARRLSGSTPRGYAAVFAIEAIGMLLCLPLLRAVDPAKFAREAAGPPAAAAEAPPDAASRRPPAKPTATSRRG